jgi:DNA-binding transcriptional regulator YiaG
MPNLNSVLKSEIARLARKEIKGAIDPLRKSNAGYRRDIAELKRQVAAMQRELKASSRSSKTRVASKKEATRNRPFLPKALKATRSRLGLSAADLGLLVGASAQSIYNWESGKTVPREAQNAALASLRSIGKREAATRLESLA